MNGYTYDTGALIAADRGDREMWALHKDALLHGILPTVPAGVLAQAWRGGPQHQLSRLLKGCEVELLGESDARAIGTRAARTGHTDVVDVSVVVGALRRRDVVLTSDPVDIAQATGGEALVVEAI